MKNTNSFKLIFILYFTFILIYGIISYIFTKSTDYHNLTMHKSLDAIKVKIKNKRTILEPTIFPLTVIDSTAVQLSPISPRIEKK